MARLYHITVKMPSRDESPEGIGRHARELRTYTALGPIAAKRKRDRLALRFGDRRVQLAPVDPETRNPVC